MVHTVHLNEIMSDDELTYDDEAYINELLNGHSEVENDDEPLLEDTDMTEVTDVAVVESPTTKKKVRKRKSVKKGVAKKKTARVVTRYWVSEAPSAFVKVDDDSITYEDAQQMLGWVTESDDLKFGDDFLCRDIDGRKVRCENNKDNVPFAPVRAATYKQEILNGNWRLNGEPVIFGVTGNVLSAQHTLVGFILAVQTWRRNPDEYPLWKEEPTLSTYVSVGIDESDEVVNTIDTGKRRQLSHVLFRSEILSSVKKKDRTKVAKMCDSPVRTVWDRTGQKFDAYSPRLTHSEALGYLKEHPKLIQCVKNIHDQDVEQGISKYLPPGVAAGLLYLMGCDSTKKGGKRAWSSMTKAKEYFRCIAKSEAASSAVGRKIVGLFNQGLGTLDERVALVVMGWLAYKEKTLVEAKDLKLKYNQDRDGFKYLSEYPSVGGIDYGKPTKSDIHLQNGEDVKEKKPKKLRKTSPTVAVMQGEDWVEGDVAWVYEPDQEVEQGVIRKKPYSTDQGDYVEIEIEGRRWEVKVEHLSLSEPQD